MRVWSIACVPLSSVEGPATHVRELHEALAEHLDELELYLPDLGLAERTHIAGVVLRRIRVPNLPVIRFAIFDLLVAFHLLGRLLCGSAPDALYLRQSYSTLLPGLLARAFAIPLVVEVNGFFDWDLRARRAGRLVRAISRLAEWTSYSGAARILCVTDGIRQQLSRSFRTDLPAAVLRNGVNTGFFQPRPAAVCRSELGLSPSATIVGYVGCFTPWDGIELLVSAAKRLAGADLDLLFVLVGQGHDYQRIQTLVSAAGLSECFRCPGFIDRGQLRSWICSFDIAVAPYIAGRNEMGVSSLKCLEYFACGIPTIAGGVPEMDYIESSGGGRLMPPGDADALAALIQELLADAPKRQMMGRLAREYVLAHSGWDAIAAATAAHLKQATYS